MSSVLSFDDEWSYDNEIPEFKPEMNAYDRVGAGGGLTGIGPQNRFERSMMEPLDRFRLHVDAIARSLNNWEDVDISEQSIQLMVETASKLNAVGHKNATAYVLGFLATGGGVKLQKKYYDHVITNVLPHADEGSVLPQDVIRYARLWQQL